MRKNFKRIICFVAVVAVLQSLALLLLTPSGIELIYPFCLRSAAEKIKTESNSYAVYYDMRMNTAEADIIVVGIDENVDTSFDMLGHFTRFVKQYNNVSDILLDLNHVQANLVTFLFQQTDEVKFNSFMNKLKDGTGMSDAFCEYFSVLFFVNTTMTPQKKFNIASYSDNYISDDGIMTAEETEDNRSLAEKLSDKIAESERSALCVVDSRELENGSDFRTELNGLLPDKNILYIQTHYTKSCPSAETHTIYSFPFEPEGVGVYFVDNSELDGIYSYYSFVTEIYGSNKNFENKLNTRSTDYFFVITGDKIVDTDSGDETISG